MNIDGLLAQSVHVTFGVVAYGYGMNRIGTGDVALWAANRLAAGASDERTVRLTSAEHLERQDVVELLGPDEPLDVDTWLLAELLAVRETDYGFEELEDLQCRYGHRQEMSWCSRYVDTHRPLAEDLDEFIDALRRRLGELRPLPESGDM